ncbi:MAG: alpha/beta hydrolase [Patescibacteria group bacterium]|nr:alpha/beta hydrolase [Patescibacteria group bacterium]
MQKKVVSFDKTIINYEIDKKIKKGHKRPVLIFVHGVGGNLKAWEEERKYLRQKDFRTLALDLRGHGLSDRPHTVKDYSLNKFSKDIYRIVQKEKIINFILIGHCFGGMITINFHNLYPNLTRSYVLIDSAPKAPQVLKNFISNNPFLINLLNSRLHKRKSVSEQSVQLDYKKFIGTGDWNIKRIYNDITHTSFKSWVFTFQNLARFNGVKILKNIKQPVLIINGEKDSIFQVEVAQKINHLVKNSRLHIIPDANHVLIINNPKILAKYIADFVKNF